MYAIIYDFFYNSLGLDVSALASSSWTIGGQSVNGASWLCHSATIIVLAVLVFTAFKFLWWLVRLIGNAFMVRG